MAKSFKEIISSISESNKVPKKRVRQVLNAFSAEIGKSFDSLESIVAPDFKINFKEQKERQASHDVPYRAKRTIGRVYRKAPKES